MKAYFQCNINGRDKQYALTCFCVLKILLQNEAQAINLFVF